MYIKYDKTKCRIAKGTILLIHGTAAQNIDGEILGYSAAEKEYIKNTERAYQLQTSYQDLSLYLNKLGWDTIRYTRSAVKENNIDKEEYKKSDLKQILEELNYCISLMPKDRVKILFAWSGGSIHVLQLPLHKINGIVILGGIATKRKYLEIAAADNNIEEIEKIKNIYTPDQDKNMEMYGRDMPFKRLWDEDALDENWIYLKNYPNLPALILHGTSDTESPVEQAYIWKEKLPQNDITLVIKENGNHAFGIDKNGDMNDIANYLNNWVNEKIISTS